MSPPTPAPAAAPARTRKKPGPKPRPLEQRPFTLKPVTRVKRTYGKAKKIEVLMFLQHHRIQRDTDTDDPGYLRNLIAIKGPCRPPTFAEAARWFKISSGTIKSWWKNRDAILEDVPKDRRTKVNKSEQVDTAADKA